MPERLVLCIDLGSSSVRGSLVDEQLSIGAAWSAPLPARTPVPNFVDYDALAVAAAVEQVCDAALAEARPAAIAITNQRATTAMWKSDGQAVGPILSWMDLRTAPMCLALAEKGISIAPNQSATKAAFLASLVPEEERPDLRFGTLDSFVLWQLTGGQVHATDHTNAAMTGFIQSVSLAWDDRVLAELGLPHSILPQVLPSAGEFGHALGGIPVLGVAGDQQASLIGLGCLAQGQAKVTFGTGTMLDQALGIEPPPDTKRKPKGTFPIVAYSQGGTVVWGSEAIALATGSMINWLMATGIMRTLEDANRSDPDFRAHSELRVVPANVGLGTPEWDFGARSVITGLDLSTTSADIVAATLDAVAQIAADLVEATVADTGHEISRLRADGAMCRNSAFVQMVADACGIEVELYETTEASTQGAALLAHAQLAGANLAEYAGSLRRSPTIVSPRTPRGGTTWKARREAWRETKDLSRESIPELSAVHF